MDDDEDYIKQVEYTRNQWRSLTVGEVIQILELEDPTRIFPMHLELLRKGADIAEDLDKHLSMVLADTIK